MELRITLMYSILRKSTYACKTESKNQVIIDISYQIEFLGNSIITIINSNLINYQLHYSWQIQRWYCTNSELFLMNPLIWYIWNNHHLFHWWVWRLLKGLYLFLRHTMNHKTIYSIIRYIWHKSIET